MSARPFPILCILPAGVADAVLASGLVRRLHDEIPNAQFTIVSSLKGAALFRDLPGLGETIVWRAEGFASRVELWKRVRRRKWGFILDAGDARIAKFISAKQKAAARPASEAMHRVDDFARILRLEDEPPAPFLFTSADTEMRADQLCAGPGPILAMAPGARWVGETWPIERFSFTATRLLGAGGALAGGRLMVCAGPDDWKAAEPLRRAVGRERCIELSGEDLLTTYACLSRSDLFIGNATGTMHLAAAAGCPTIGLFGPTDEARYAPHGPTARVVRGVRTFADFHRLDPGLGQPVCHMFDITVDAVVAAAEALLRETEDRAQNRAHA